MNKSLFFSGRSPTEQVMLDEECQNARLNARNTCSAKSYIYIYTFVFFPLGPRVRVPKY